MRCNLVDFQVVLLAETPTAWKVRRVGGAYPAVWVLRERSEIYEPDAIGVRQLTMAKATAFERGMLK